MKHIKPLIGALLAVYAATGLSCTTAEPKTAASTAKYSTTLISYGYESAIAESCLDEIGAILAGTEVLKAYKGCERFGDCERISTINELLPKIDSNRNRFISEQEACESSKQWRSLVSDDPNVVLYRW